MDVVLDNIPITVKTRADGYELVVCGMVVAEENVPKNKSLAWYLEGYEKDPDRNG